MKPHTLKALVTRRLEEVEVGKPFRIREILTHKNEGEIIKILDSLAPKVQARFTVVCPDCYTDVYHYPTPPTSTTVHVCHCRYKFELKMNNMELTYVKPSTNKTAKV